MIISVSRRTDIPAFFYNELQNALRGSLRGFINPVAKIRS